MAGGDFESEQRVVLLQAVEDVEIPVGAAGTVVEVDKEKCQLDVVFDAFGIVRGIDAKCIGPQQ